MKNQKTEAETKQRSTAPVERPCYPPDPHRFATTIALRLFKAGYTNFSDHGPVIDLIRDVLTERHAVASTTRIACPDCGEIDLPCDVFDGGRGVRGASVLRITTKFTGLADQRERTWTNQKT